MNLRILGTPCRCNHTIFSFVSGSFHWVCFLGSLCCSRCAISIPFSSWIMLRLVLADFAYPIIYCGMLVVVVPVAFVRNTTVKRDAPVSVFALIHFEMCLALFPIIGNTFWQEILNIFPKVVQDWLFGCFHNGIILSWVEALIGSSGF